jgi:hypothetical protein
MASEHGEADSAAIGSFSGFPAATSYGCDLLAPGRIKRPVGCSCTRSVHFRKCATEIERLLVRRTFNDDFKIQRFGSDAFWTVTCTTQIAAPLS